MRKKLERSIKKLEAELEAVRKLMNDLENGCSKSNSRTLRRWGRGISRRGALALIVSAAFLLLAANLQSQQKSDNALFIDASGRIGIGTDQPKAPLEVRAPADSASAVRFGDTAGHADLIANNTYFGLRDQANNDR